MIFGAPRILHSDNRKEFVARIIKDLITLYPKTMIINGRPRHPQSQGLVEKGNDILETKLSAWLEIISVMTGVLDCRWLHVSISFHT